MSSLTGTVAGRAPTRLVEEHPAGDADGFERRRAHRTTCLSVLLGPHECTHWFADSKFSKPIGHLSGVDGLDAKSVAGITGAVAPQRTMRGLCHVPRPTAGQLLSTRSNSSRRPSPSLGSSVPSSLACMATASSDSSRETHTELDAEQLARRYTTAAEQLGHEKAAVRLAGVYAMARLAGAKFTGAKVFFDGARFVEGEISFNNAEYASGMVSFDDVEFSGSRIAWGPFKSPAALAVPPEKKQRQGEPPR